MKKYFKVFSILFALSLSLISFTVASALTVGAVGQFARASEGFDEVIKKRKSPAWVKDFYKKIDELDLQDLKSNLAKRSELERSYIANYKTTKQVAILPDKIIIPKLGKALPVSNPQTDNLEKLNSFLLKSVVRYPGTGFLSDKGNNIVIFGHSSHLPIVRNKMFKAFNDIETLKKGDLVVLVGKDGKKYRYFVKNVYKAKASRSSIVVNSKNKRLTLITCDNFGSKEDRWVVEAEAH